MKYIKLFDIDSDRVSYEDSENYIEPYVSYVEEDYSVHYNKPEETKLVVYYDIQDISAPTTIFTNYDNSVKSIEVDGTLLDSVVTTYQFGSVGEHVVKFEFNNPTIVGNNAPLLYQLLTVKRVVIPDTFTAIGSNAFNGCSGLTTVSIGNGVTSIGNNAFISCFSLTSIIIPDNVTSIGDSAFQNCTGLTSVTISNDVISISNYAFSDCTRLTSVIIGNNVTSINRGAFKNCISLTSIIIPDNVTSISNEAFMRCYKLESIVSLAMTAPSIEGNTFSEVKDNGVLTVPSGSNGYDESTNHWLYDCEYYLGYYNWTKVEQ